MTEKRTNIIKSVNNPLGFMVLALLVTEGLLALAIPQINASDLLYVVLGMLIILMVIIFLVGVPSLKRSASDYNVLSNTDNSIELSKFIGQYDFYYISILNGINISRSPLTIEVDDQSQIKAILKSSEYDYRGSLKLSDGVLYLFLEGDGHKEHISAILNEPLKKYFDVISGGFIAIDGERKPIYRKLVIKKVAQINSWELIPIDKIDKSLLKSLIMDDNSIISIDVQQYLNKALNKTQPIGAGEPSAELQAP